MEPREFGICCENCQLYWTCETKWYQGEKGEENICCRLCNSFVGCLIESVKKRIRKKRGIIEGGERWR